MFINGKTILANGKPDRLFARRTQVFLEKGFHDIEIKYIDDGIQYIRLMWNTPYDRRFVPVPNDVLFPK